MQGVISTTQTRNLEIDSSLSILQRDNIKVTNWEFVLLAVARPACYISGYCNKKSLTHQQVRSNLRQIIELTSTSIFPQYEIAGCEIGQK